ncbi:hypothetical protein GCM10025865_08620 [Paraoerskovia sediminicola]|uniref:Uncharacterized protein n=1 Tax=Paraoerskovia sediminicola TaxID=1138587 RepID=A0ABN6X9P5_9CELL|nr:hypothetical protein [Paraoerskovia sediminicola]BDZ41563.1 hypothetical protein GCM10025865_08620 [Paraoerskovia sediminicola]
MVLLLVILVTGALALLGAALAILAARRRPPEVDPMRSLRVQVRLTELALEMRRIETDREAFARAHHYLAVQGAYDALLREACDLAGLPVSHRVLLAGRCDDPTERLREEVELSARGWTW